MLDGKIVALDRHGKTQFKDLLFRRGEPRFYAFDLPWCEGEDQRHMSLIDRKHRLRSVIPNRGERLLYCDHIEQDGERMFRLACEHDIEGIVAKHKGGLYLPDRETTWLKIRNRSYSQWVRREELFERERGGDPDIRGWDSCVRACAPLLPLPDSRFRPRFDASKGVKAPGEDLPITFTRRAGGTYSYPMIVEAKGIAACAALSCATHGTLTLLSAGEPSTI